MLLEIEQTQFLREDVLECAVLQTMTASVNHSFSFCCSIVNCKNVRKKGSNSYTLRVLRYFGILYVYAKLIKI
jgi:hypothetical protein